MEPAPQVVLTEQGLIVKSRAYRRARKNRAMLEGRKSKKYYTKKKKNRR